jgi:hypothetical protein
MQSQSLQRGVAILASIPDTPPYAHIRKLRAQLEAVVHGMPAMADDEWSARRGRGYTGKTINHDIRALRKTHLIPVARKARRLFKHEPKILAALVLPHAKKPAAEHAAAALTIAKALRPHVALCHEFGIRRGFLPELRKAGEALRIRSKASTSARETSSRMTRRLQVGIVDARDLVKDIQAELDGLILSGAVPFNELYNLRLTTEVYKRAIRLRSPVGRPRKRNQRPRAEEDEHQGT